MRFFERHDMIIGGGIILATIAVVLAIYFGARRILGTEPAESTQDLSASVLFRISALHGLVLALVFASEVVEYNSLEFESAIEVNAISDVYYDAARYGDDGQGIRPILQAYLETVISEEWLGLGDEGGLSSQAWTHWNAAYDFVLDLNPSSPRQVALRDNMIEKIHVIAVNRDLREYHAKTSLGLVFWIAAIVGVFLISVGYYSFPPKRDNLILLSVFATYTGLILFTIYAMSNPFSAPVALEPIFFMELLREIES